MRTRQLILLLIIAIVGVSSIMPTDYQPGSWEGTDSHGGLQSPPERADNYCHPEFEGQYVADLGRNESCKCVNGLIDYEDCEPLFSTLR